MTNQSKKHVAAALELKVDPSLRIMSFQYKLIGINLCIRSAGSDRNRNRNKFI